jgi:hypothetical protein
LEGLCGTAVDGGQPEGQRAGRLHREQLLRPSGEMPETASVRAWP